MEAPPNKPVLPANRRREEQEMRNAEQLMYYVAKQLTGTPNLPLTEELVCELHEITTQNIDYPDNTPGKYRTWAVRAGTYVPPQDGAEIVRLMEEFISWFNEGAPTKWDPVVGAIVAHFYIVSIHPFGDGNGRTARAVESFLLYRAGINARGFYSLANYYYQHRQEYVQRLDQIRFETDGDLTPFVLFALRGLVEELEAVHTEVLLEIREIAFRDFAHEQLHEKLATKSGERMLNFILLLGNETVSLRAIRSGEHKLASLYRSLTTKTFSRDLIYLKERGLIILKNGELRANFDIMGEFVPPYELMRPLTRQRRITRRKTKKD
jgi:Fic family protein